MKKKLLIIFCLTTIGSLYAMKATLSQEDWSTALTLAETSPNFNTKLEQLFLDHMPQEKNARDFWYIELQPEVRKRARALPKATPIQKCLLQHLTLAYCKREQAFHAEITESCKKMIAQTLGQLTAKK